MKVINKEHIERLIEAVKRDPTNDVDEELGHIQMCIQTNNISELSAMLKYYNIDVAEVSSPAEKKDDSGQGGYFRHPREHSINAIKGKRRKFGTFEFGGEQYLTNPKTGDILLTKKQYKKYRR